MDRSRSPRVTNGQLSDDARFLQRLAEGLGEGAVEEAVDEMGEQWADAYQELRPDLQPTPTDIEISNQRARELTAARTEIGTCAGGAHAHTDSERPRASCRAP